LNYLKSWWPCVAVIILFLWVLSVKADSNLDRGDWLIEENPFSDAADVSAAKPVDRFTKLREYLEQEEVHYLLRQADPAALTIYYDYGEEESGRRWSCKKFNEAFPGISLKTYAFIDINDPARGKTDFDC
jgi:hypothetical protein